ncbi:MAG TPA: hybrid sensor histidine kinase/response regulator [Janthinobacterium sp.]|nr:hybrid sensor histidine kinase/response regulator [Janthinobacterium sp.]
MEQRILIHAPTGRDGPLAAKVLAAAAIEARVCDSAAELVRQLALGAGAVLTVEEALPSGADEALTAHLARQASWSDLPIILLTHHGNDTQPVRQAIARLGNLNLLERPVRPLTLVTSAHAALRARAKQYQVREAERRKDEFLASLGHELRNPLAPIKSSAALLARLYPDAPPLLRIRDVIERQVAHLTRLVDDLLDVARITSGKVALQRADIRLGAVIEHVVELCAQAAAAKGIAVALDVPRPDTVLFADQARVVQILANIVTNALKFTPAGGRVALSARVEGEALRVDVEDNGGGIAPAALGRIFSIFEQGQAGPGQMASGLGIGLSLSRRFAEMHGGSVEAHSEGLGKGSRFVVRLPVVVAAPPTPPEAARDGPAKAARVLVVDDNRDAAESLQALFQIEGYEATAVYDGAAAVAAVAEAAPDLVVMDLGMPGLDGYEAGRRIRQLTPGRRILMVALTGWSQSDARRRTLDAGFDCHLTKPVDFQAIVELANTWLGGAPLSGA